MNTIFSLTSPPTASPLLTRLDMSDVENVKDARAGLEAAGNDVTKLAAWAGRWGVVLCDRSEFTAGDGVDRGPEETPNQQLQAEIDATDQAIKEACEALSEIGAGTMTPASKSVVAKVVDELRAML